MSQAGEFNDISTFSLPQTRFLNMSRIIILLGWSSVGVFRSLTRGAMKTGDSKQTAISFRNRLDAKKLRFGKSSAKLIYFSFSFFSINAMVRLI